MLGKNSISNQILIENDGKEYVFTIQADKLYRICDISPRISNVLEEFRGRQLNSEVVYDQLYSKLYNLINQ